MNEKQAGMLTIDLSNRAARIEEIRDKIIRKYIGGRGLGSYLLHELVTFKSVYMGSLKHRPTKSPIEGRPWGLFWSDWREGALFS